jgi:acyl dehydratase
MTTKIEGIAGLKEKVGAHLGYSGWRQVTQKQVNLFADATDDHQWIHVDIERANAGPFGGPIAHGYLTLSMAPAFMNEILEVSGVAMGVNYGLNKLRFPSPVPVGSRLRAGAVLSSVEDVAGGVQVVLELTFETEGGTKPACVAEVLFRYYS